MNNLGRGNEEKKKNKERLLTRETVGFVLVLFALLSLVILITRSLIFGDVGFAISSFLLGVFGYCSYAVLAALVYAGIVLVTGKKISASGKTVAFSVLLFVCFVCLVHTITADVGKIAYKTYGSYLKECYYAGEGSGTGGGVIFGVLVYPVVKLTTSVGGYIIFSLLMVGVAYLLYSSRSARVSESKRRTELTEKMIDDASSDTSGMYSLNYGTTLREEQAQQPTFVRDDSERAASEIISHAETAQERSRRLYSVSDNFELKSKRELKQERRYAETAKSEPKPAAQPLTPYAQSRGILYPDSGMQYKNNLIFDSDSYFNNPNRGAISKQQYADNFRSAPTSITEGHERSNRSETPAVQNNSTAVQNNVSPAPQDYSGYYRDEADGNITYTNRPKKIVTDTTKPNNPVNTDQNNSFYRNDVITDYSSGKTSFSNSSPSAEAISGETRRGATPPVSPEKIEKPATDLNNNPFSARTNSDLSASRGNQYQSEKSESVGRGGLTDGSYLSQDSKPLSRGGNDRLSDVRSSEVSRSDRFEQSKETTENIRVENNYNTGRNISDINGVSERKLREDKEQEFGKSEPAADESRGLKSVSDGFDSAANLFDDDEPEVSSVPDVMDKTRLSVSRPERGRDVPSSRTPINEGAQDAVSQLKPKHVYAKYNPPPVSLLADYADLQEADPEEIARNEGIIVDTLEQLKIPSQVLSVTQGPTVTRYDIDIPGHIPTGKVLSCDKEIAMRLHAKDGVNIQTNYENGSISIEVPNRTRATVGLKSIIQSDQFVNAKPGSLMFGLGKDIEGRAISGDIVKMKHVLVAGSTGSGKSVCLNALIISLLYKYSPEELRLILVDPKQVEFNIYEKLPHLMVNEIIYEPNKVVNVLNWLITQMEYRYSLFKEKTKKGTLVREIDEYNAHLAPDEERLPKIVLIIDELADLMSVSKKELEERIQRLTQKSRAAGIHLILATQRPSVNVITGVIKSNLPTRIAFKVTQEVDSRTILDESGAEKLLGHGDMLYKTDTMTFPAREQGAFLDSEEVQNVVDYVKQHNEAYFDDSVSDYINNERGGGGGIDGDGDDSVEAVYIEALRHVVSIGQASISMIQRRCSVGYPKAGKIIEWMENMGYISAFDGAKARKVLLSPEEFESKYGDYGE